MEPDRDPEKNTFAIQLVIILVAMGLTAICFALFRGSSPVQVLVHNPTSSVVETRQTVSQTQRLSISPSPEAAPLQQSGGSDLPTAGRALSSVSEEPGGSADLEAVPLARSVNLNTAGFEELQTLPGIGPVLAERIMEYREVSGGFTRIDEICDVSGIGEKTFQKIQDYITVE